MSRAQSCSGWSRGAPWPVSQHSVAAVCWAAMPSTAWVEHMFIASQFWRLKLEVGRLQGWFHSLLAPWLVRVASPCVSTWTSLCVCVQFLLLIRTLVKLSESPSQSPHLTFFTPYLHWILKYSHILQDRVLGLPHMNLMGTRLTHSHPSLRPPFPPLVHSSPVACMLWFSASEFGQCSSL